MYTEISIKKLYYYAAELQGCELNISRQRQQLIELITTIDDNNHSLAAVRLALKKQELQLERDVHLVKLLRVALEKIIALYVESEEEILDYEEVRKGIFSEVGFVSFERWKEFLREYYFQI